MIMTEKEPARAEASLKDALAGVRAGIGKLAEKSQEAYIRESISPAKKEGLKTSVDVLNGIFIAPELHWDLIVKKLGGKYEPKKHPAGETMEKIMGLKNVFPPTAIERNFPPGDKSFCTAEIKFKPRLLSKSDAVYRLKTVKEQANETDDWAKPLMDWLKSQTTPGFYYVVEFEIVCVFDFEQFTRARMPDLFKEIKANVKEKKGGDKENLTKDLLSWATTLLEKEARELAKWATEYVAREQVLEDLCNAIDAAVKQAQQKKKVLQKGAKQELPKNLPFWCTIMREPVKNEGSPKENALSAKHLILTYKPAKLKLVAYINDKDEAVKIRLGEEIRAKIEVRKRAQDEFVVDKNLKVVIESKYFKEQAITFLNPKTGNFLQWELDESNKEFVSISTPKDALPQLHPNIRRITKKEEELVEYPVIFKLVRSSGNNVSGDTVQYCKTQLNVEFELPKIRFKMTRQYFPRKGEQFDVKFDVWVGESNSSRIYDIPVKVVCYPGEDFSTVKPSSAAKKEISEDLNIDNNPKRAVFPLIAKRASFPGYYNSAYFEFFVGDDPEPVERWRLNITVLPNLLDTFVAGGTGLLGILSVAYPDIFPAITQGVSIANLEIIPATIYLVYRVLIWSRKTG